MLFLDPATQNAIASWCGYTSIACWLGAQLPQVIKNWRQQNCDGLALPFLVNWLSGDITNLIGCILTNQLPFQTYLATYFCFVDVALVVQYFYYLPRTPSVMHRHVSPHASLVLPPATRSQSVGHIVPTIPTSPLPPVSGLPRSNSGRGRRRQPPHHAHTIAEPPGYNPADPAEALYAAALDVARAAERVSLRRSNSGRPRARHAATAPPDEASPLLDSFHSDMSLHSSTDEEEEHRRMTQSMGNLDRHNARGRSLTRVSTGLSNLEGSDTVDDLNSGLLEVRRRTPSRSASRARAARGTGRRAAGVAFMSVGLLLWKVTGEGSGAGPGTGRVVVRNGAGRDSMVSSAVGSDASGVGERNTPWQPDWPLHPLPLPVGHTLVARSSDSEPKPKPEEPVDWQQMIGRISAWCCTTLYLTSRLPQIWKNFQRKSVEGLSILLFLFAFLGNSFYVLSIVLAPAPPGQAAHYLLRALPYLLGSGGTLIFDLSIMIQAAIYGSAPPSTPLEQRHRRSYSYGGRRRGRVYTEDGLGERRSLLHSPARAVTEPWGRPLHEASGASSTHSISGLWIRTSDSPKDSGTPASPARSAAP